MAQKNPTPKKLQVKTELTDELSPRWAAFLEHYLATSNAFQSAIKAGFSEEYAKVITSRYPEQVRKSLREVMEARGITADKIAEKIGLLLDATKGEEPDYQAIDKGITHAVKIRGDVAEDVPHVTHTTYNQLFSFETQQKVKQIEDTIKAQLMKPHDTETN